ncbi:hypothetical protein FMM58_02610 [Campylobacter sp. LR291e]|uniref:hypothetical protein n=1 Tax=unclassified Campylobacter TaxID=2593542 RepID=UPI001237A5F7|nr:MULTISPECIES: hypothetical protein [unclassified Campylobacter]KAA6226101.1 hypothetical protein FMM54_04670 [Campylobacter sp. LR185c]KAA6231301.1 hypothetical protein FMM56_03810 [Campylobacter sp. LR264d]KAA6231513.1 hypothetical protein FMM58_02610 [Campylobacter sp. LR291e]KAA8604600.1 hypothetical protein CGP82_01305 [Campylobacter sp. LR185c]
MKKIVIILLFLSTCFSAVINSVAIVVESEPITMYDIEHTKQNLGVSSQEAISLLVNEKIELIQMKQFNVYVNELEVDTGIEKLLEQNRVDMDKLKQDLAAKNQSYESFRAKFKKDLEKRKLNDRIASTTKLDFSTEGAKKYFEQNQNKFVFYTSISVYIYRSKDEKELNDLALGKISNIKPQSEQLNLENADPRLLGLLSSIEIDSFAPVLDSANGFELYQVKAKSGAQNITYEQAENEILNAYINDQKQNYIKDYFDKMRSKANIKYLLDID